MNKNDYNIRLEKKEEHRQVEELVREVFWNVYCPGYLEHYVLHCLRKDAALCRQVRLGFAIMACRRARMLPSFYVKN